MGIPSDILGLTVLAWGNSIGDTVSNVIVAKQGVSVCVRVRACVRACMSFEDCNIYFTL